MQQANPILVEVTRDPAMESFHRGSAVVVDRNGGLVKCWGDPTSPVFPRSAVKPLQALALLTSGAARALGVSDEEIALACASHNGEPLHTAAVEQWLRRLGYAPETLECGAHAPRDKETRQQLLRENGSPSPLHNNCSGKHAGFLTICRYLGLDPAGYIGPAHPVQLLVRDTLTMLTGCRLDNTPCGVDGCGIPVYGIPLEAIATGMMKLAEPGRLDASARDAAYRIRRAMVANPYLVAGRKRFCTTVMEALAPNVLVKTGAEGVFCAAVLDQGLGVALKIDDGATRASEAALGAILRGVGAISETQYDALASTLEPAVLNVAGRRVGRVKAAEALL